ncbi:MAG: D-alanyl-D-alanine carboxypeptidase family protein, partial [Oscillospiraceae bacterium]
MKKIATLLILCSLALSLTACSGKTDDSYTELSSKESSTTVQPPETSASSAQSQPSAKPAISYYNAALSERYETYKAKNTGITEEEAVLAVNMGLDFAFYEKIKPIKNQSSLLALCNKYYNLQESYEPTDLVAVRNENSGLANMRLREEANNAFNKMADAAKKDGRKLVVTSSYRPYSSQKRLYNNYVS